MYSIEQITEQNKWDDFVDSCSPNTFMNAWAWGEVETNLGHTVYRFGIYEKGVLIGVFSAVVITARRGNILICPHGPLFIDGELSRVTNTLPKIKSTLKQIGKEHSCVCVRMCPLLPKTPEVEGVFSQQKFRRAPIHVYSELARILDITKDEDTLLKGMKKNTRYGIRKAAKDVIEIKSSTDDSALEAFWDLYQETAERQKFVVYQKDMIKAEFEAFKKNDRARWYLAYHEGKVVSAALIIYSQDTAYYHHGASLSNIRSITPSEGLQWQVIKDAKENGLQRYNFWGVVPEEAKDHPWAGLSRFKRGFGGYEEAYLHTQDLPLSIKYLLTWTIERVRKWKRRV